MRRLRTGRTGRLRRGAAAVAGLVAVAVGATACSGNGLYDVNLPGGADLGSHPYTVTAQFTDVLDLVPQSAVRVNNVAVGRVSKISLGGGGKFAVVQLRVNGSVHLPANATASIQQSSLLGEKFVDLSAPPNPVGTLTNGATIKLTATSTGIDIEQIFGALSLLLNGGGVAQLHTIVSELAKATGGRGENVRGLLVNADHVINQLNAHRSDIVAALDQLNQLSKTLNQNRADISVALRDLPAGLKVLASQRQQLVTMVNSLGNLSRVAVHTVRASRTYFVNDLKALDPILNQLVQAGSALPESLQILLTFPFPDSVLQAIKGDYLNAFVTTNLNTPGGRVVHTRTPQHAVVTAPPTLLPATSSAAPGLPEPVIVTTPSASPAATPSGGGR